MYWYQWTVGFLFYVFIYFYSTDVCYLLPVGMGSRSWFLFLARRNWALSRSPFSIFPSWFQFVPLILRQQNCVCVWIFCSHIVPWTQWGWMEEFHEVLRGWLDHFGPEYTVGLRQRLIFCSSPSVWLFLGLWPHWLLILGRRWMSSGAWNWKVMRMINQIPSSKGCHVPASVLDNPPTWESEAGLCPQVFGIRG